MHEAKAHKVIHVPPERVWALVADVTRIAEWHPTVAKVDLISASPTGLRAARRCHFPDGTSVREEVIALEEGRTIRLRLTEFSVPMKRLEVEITVAATADGHSEATFGLHYQVKWGVLGRLLGATVMRRELRKMAAKLLNGLNRRATTGEAIAAGSVANAA